MTSDEETLYVDVKGKQLRVSHLSKVLFPDDGITKAVLLQYYHDIADFMLPHIRGRPLTIKGIPAGYLRAPVPPA